MKIIYIAGPYRADTTKGVRENIRQAEKWAIYFWKKGWAVICPHKNTALFDGIADDEIWLKGDIEIMKRCDAVFAMPGWKKSSGARAEIKEAEQLKMKIIYSPKSRKSRSRQGVRQTRGKENRSRRP